MIVAMTWRPWRRYTRKSGSSVSTTLPECCSDILTRHASAREIGTLAYRTSNLANEEARFGEHGLAGDEGRNHARPLRHRPLVVSVPPVEEGDEWSGVEQDLPAHRPKPRMCRLLWDRS